MIRPSAILAQVTRWAANRDDIVAIALVGSWARGTAREDSDVDLVLLTPHPLWFRRTDRWLNQIDWHAIGSQVATWRDADYGVVWSRHLRLADGTEIEFGFGPLTWASVDPVDPGTLQVISDGCRILFDPQGLLEKLVKQVKGR